jgi:hypothetical protein
MKSLTICQPYAHLIAIGEKRVPAMVQPGRRGLWDLDEISSARCQTWWSRQEARA